MNVAELIEILKTFPADAPVKTVGDDDETVREATTAKLFSTWEMTGEHDTTFVTIE